MPKYRLLEKSYFDQGIELEDGTTVAGVLLEAGTIVNFPGIPGTNMHPLDDEANVAHLKAVKARRDGLRPLTKQQEAEAADENPMLNADQLRQSREFRAEAAQEEAKQIELGKIEMRKLPQPEPEPAPRSTLHAPQQHGKPNR